MMELKTIKLDGVTYLAPKTFFFNAISVEKYDSYCGAGSGIGDKIVPETIWGKKVSHICHIHDHSWQVAENTVVDFLLTNALFLVNLVIYLIGSKPSIIGYLRGLRAITYFMAVNTIGWNVFKNLKRNEATQ